MTDSFEEAIAGLSASLQARLAEVAATGLTHLPRPVKQTPASAQKPLGASPVAVAKEPIVPPSGSLSPADPLQQLETETIGNCTRCKLHRARTRIVFGVGNPNADLVFVGEGPGAEEDRQGEPFVGRAGQLLTKIIQAMGLDRDHVYICNVVKCRPPNNRDPQPDEVTACEPFLKAQLDILNPKVIVTLGRYASQTLLQSSKPMGQLQGEWASYEGIEVMPTYHPAYLLRSEMKKKDVWLDMQKVMTRLGLEDPRAMRSS